MSRTMGIHPLYASNNGDATKGFRKSFLEILYRISNSSSRWIQTYGDKWNSRVKRLAVTLCATFFLWFGSFGCQLPPANAASPSIAIQKILPSAPLEKIVDRYVKDYMFDDDVYDPVESTFRETYDDVTSGEYPKALEDITVGILGKKAVKKDDGGNGIIRGLQVVQKILVRLGFSEKAAQLTLAVATFSAMAGGFIISIGLVGSSIKAKMGRRMKKRYGDDFTMDASKPVKKANDDDEGDDDDDDDDKDDGDDDEDEDEDEDEDD